MNTIQDAPAKLPLRAGVEARDLDAVVNAFTPDAIVHSPLTGRLVFSGHHEIRALFGVILDVFEDVEYTEQLQACDVAILVLSARVRGQDIQVVDHILLDEQGRIREMTAFFRPMPAIAASLRALGTGLARRRGRGRAAVVSALTAPMEVMTRTGDGIGVRLVEPALRD